MQRPPLFHPPRTSLAAVFDSHPSDVVLVKSYLRPWVSSGVRPHGAFVHAADLYAAEPGDLARRHRAAVARDGERAWYFLSPLRTKSPRGRRKARTVAGGAGWWHGEGGPRPVLDPLDGKRKVGYRQSFSYMRREGADGPPVRTGWIMVELRLHDGDGEEGDGAGAGGGIEDQLEGLVLCKVYRSPRHPDTARHGGGEEESCAAAADDDVSSDALPRATAVIGGKRKAEDDEGSSAAATSSTAAGSPGVKKPAAAEDEVEISGATTAAARGDREGKKAAEDDDGEDSSASTPARKRARADGEASTGTAVAAAAPGLELKMAASAAAPALERKVVGFPMPQQLLCPECGFHIGALQAVVAPAKTTPETAGIVARAGAPPQGGARTGDNSGKDPSTHRLLLRFSDPKQA
ncbi:unnamed protein product [Urochloa decumbens]|uniref:NAC domain-containing protein n=1 Tax=Urochloa decumbens TaxID=240449 RepID=A0ABC9DAF0_9POAL